MNNEAKDGYIKHPPLLTKMARIRHDRLLPFFYGFLIFNPLLVITLSLVALVAEVQRLCIRRIK